MDSIVEKPAKKEDIKNVFSRYVPNGKRKKSG
jgi:hypothetical protein